MATAFGRQDSHIACYVSFNPHLQDPNAPEPLQVSGFAPEIEEFKLPTPVFIGDEKPYQRLRVIETSIGIQRKNHVDARLIVYPGVGHRPRFFNRDRASIEFQL